MSYRRRKAAICDANVLIDYVAADEDVVRELVAYWSVVYVPTRILHEVRRLSEERAVELGLTIIETPLELSHVPGLSGPDRACLHFVVSEGWTCIANDRVLRKECKKQGGKVVWGIEMLLKLVSAKQISAARASDLAEEISRVNPEITEKIVTEFRKKLSRLPH